MEVHLNVYDLTPANGYAYWFGLGVFHSGVEVHGVEYAYGAHEHSMTGIFDIQPKQGESLFTFRKSILIGWTDMSPGEVKALMKELGRKYRGDAYNLFSNNCNHFCNEACIKLTGMPIPRWVNRLARIGLFCNCMVPDSVGLTKVGSDKVVGGGNEAEKDKESEGEKKKLNKSYTSMFFNSTSAKPSSLCPLPVAAASNGA